MAETVNSSAEAEERRELERMVPPLTRPRQQGVVYGGRFMLAYLILVLVFGTVAAVTIYLVARDDDPAWAPFKPEGGGLARATNIANHVGPMYRVGDRQLAVVEAQPPFVNDRVISNIAIARERVGPVGGGFQSMEPAGRTLFYVFCGLGPDCALNARVTQAHFALMLREALELSLYTFKYMNGIDAVVALLPPTPNEPLAAVYLRRRALTEQLDKPLAETLTGGPPYTPTAIPDRRTVERLAAHRMFPAYFQPVANGGITLRLGGPPPEDPPQAAGASRNP